MSITTTPYGFIPTEVSNCSLWLDAADSSTVTLSGSTATQWNDKSGNGRNSTSCSATYSNRINGLNCMTNPIISGPITNSGSSIVTIFIVGTKASTGGLYDSMLALNLSPITNYYGAGTLFACYYGGTSPPQFYCYMSGNLSLSFVGAVNTPFIFNAFQTGTTGSTFGNGTSYGNVSTAGSTFNYTTYYIGLCTGGPAWVGNICEIIVYNSILSISQRQQVESYLGQKWGIRSSLPVAHPGLTNTVFRSTYLKNTVVKKNIARMIPFFTAFTPRQIPGLILWVDGADPAGTGVIPADGATVSTWVDKSGLVNNATTHSGTTTYSSLLKALFFSNSGFQTSIVTPTNRVGSGFFVVRATVNSGNVVFQGSGLASGGRQFRNDNGTTLRTVKENILDMFFSGPTVLNTLMLVGYIDDGNNLTHCVNGNLYTTTTATTFNAGTTILLGKSINGEYLIGFIHEVVLFNTNVTIIQRQQIESYLAQKWGLTSSLVAGHSHLTQPAGARTALSLVNSKITITSRPISFLPTSIAGIQMWMDGADPAGTGVVPSNGSVLSTWTDKSGKSYSATGVNSPTVVTNAVNSKSVVSYNGSSYSYATIASGIFSTAMNIFFVYKVNGGVSYMAPMTRGQGNNGSPIDQYNNVRYLGGGSYNNIQSAYSHASATSTTLFTQLIQQSPSTTYNEYVNGSTTASASGTGFSASDAASYVYIATRDDKVTSFNGYMCELIVYNQMIGLTAQQKIEGYLAWKWGIQASLPAGHPYKSAAP